MPASPAAPGTRPRPPAPSVTVAHGAAAPPDNHWGELSWRGVLRHGANVAVACLSVGLVLGYLRGDGYLRSSVYSLCIGISSWLLIDLGRFALVPDRDSGWPRGWRGPALCILGCTLGFAIGEALGDLINGFRVYSGYARGVRNLANDVAVSALIGTLMSGYFYLRGKDRWHLAQAARTERDLTLARLNMLQTQLEPHMLFNTLANLRVLIALDAPRAQAMLDHLNAYLRATLGASRAPWHPLAAEFERLADYLALMAVRMGPRLAVQFELPDALRAVPVPPLLLQPLVENAIQHGLEPKIEGGRIVVSAEAVAAGLRLTVRDTGVGLPGGAAAPAGTVAGANPAGHAGKAGYAGHAGHGGFGTQHVAERLATLYGQRASLRLSAADNAEGGTLAEVLLPLDWPDAATR